MYACMSSNAKVQYVQYIKAIKGTTYVCTYVPE